MVRLDVTAGSDVPKEADLLHGRRVVTTCDRGCIVDDDPAGIELYDMDTAEVRRLDLANLHSSFAEPDVEFLGETAICDRPEARYGRRHL